ARHGHLGPGTEPRLGAQDRLLPDHALTRVRGQKGFDAGAAGGDLVRVREAQQGARSALAGLEVTAPRPRSLRAGEPCREPARPADRAGPARRRPRAAHPELPVSRIDRLHLRSGEVVRIDSLDPPGAGVPRRPVPGVRRTTRWAAP